MSATDDLRRLQEQVRQLERQMAEVKAATGKLPTRTAKGGGAGGGNGQMWFRDSYYLLTLIPNAADGDFGYATTRDDLYIRRNGVWRIVSYFSATTASAPTVATEGVDVGDEWYDITTGIKYFWGDDAAWHSYTHFKEPA